jgi:aryl sulfotransferase
MADARPRYVSLVYDSARWDGFRFRDGDIVISTPPKCGTTWTQMICALLVFQTPELPEKLDLLSPWLDMLTRDLPSVVADLDAQQHRRFIKTHTPFDGLPHDGNVTYICVGRDPRDVAMSWDNHLANLDITALFTARQNAVGLDDIMEKLAEGLPPPSESEIERFWAWVDDPTPVEEAVSLASTMHHLATFWDVRAEPNIVLMHYDDMLEDLERQMRALAARLAIDVPEERWPALVRAATFDDMRDRADVTAPDTTNAIWQDNKRFFNRGCSGQWQSVLTADDQRRYAKRVSELAKPDLVEWAHHGPLEP